MSSTSMSPKSTPPVRVDVALVPSLREPPSPRTVAIVVDVIRATTTLSVLFERGCRRVLVAPDIASARAARDQFSRDQSAREAADPPPLLAGEVGGVAPAGFDAGNSPAEFGALSLRGREVIFATTNGTRALLACAGDGAIFSGSFRNARAVCAAALAASARLRAAPSDMPSDGRDAGLAAAGPDDQASEAAPNDGAAPDIVIVCAGRDARPAYDDTLCAGYLAAEIRRQAEAAGMSRVLYNGARIALAVLGESNAYPSLRDQLATSSAAAAIRRVGLAGDLAWCADVDAAKVVPRVTGQEAGLLVVEAA